MEWKPGNDLLERLYDPRIREFPPKPLVWALLSLATADDIAACLGESRSVEDGTDWTAFAVDPGDLIVVAASSTKIDWCWESKVGEHDLSARRIPSARISELRVTRVEAVRGGIAPTVTAWASEYEIGTDGGETFVLPSAIDASDQRRRDEIEQFWAILTTSRCS